MISIDPSTITEIAEAQDLIATLQQRLLIVENTLDDLARSAEISVMSRQFQLLDSFINAANECLKERLTVPEEEPQDLKVRVITDENVSS